MHDLLRIRPGEGRTVALISAVMVFASAGYTLGGTGIEALFFSRFGVQFLPHMYMALGVATLLASLAITALLGRLPRSVLYASVPLALAALLVGARALLLLNISALYPALWLGKEVMSVLIGLVGWGLAGTVFDTRQAKRLFPLLGAGRILGSVIGGLGTGVLVKWLGTENLLLAWAGAMVAAFAAGRALMSGRATAARPGRSRTRQAGFVAEMQQGFQTARRSPLMRWVSVAALLFSVLYFSLALPFSKAAAAQFPDEDALASFLGLFQGLSTAGAFVAALFLANRLFGRFGIMPMLLAFPVIYLVGFGVLAAYAAFPIIVGFRYVQMVWLSGIADSAYQAMFSTVPSERRDQVRAFMDGVPTQAGTFIAGAVLLVGEQALASQQLYLVGLISAAALTFVVWRASRAYGRALVAALRAGQPQLFFAEEEPFGGFRRDAAAMAAAVQGLSNPDPTIRRVSAEILGNLPVPEAIRGLVAALDDPDPSVRAASLRGLANAGASSALLDVAARLHDPEQQVRVQAIEAMRRLAGFPGGLVGHLRPLLDDANTAVRVRSAAALLMCPFPDGDGHGPLAEIRTRARDLLRSTAALGGVEERILALNALAEWGDAAALPLISAELSDRHAPPAVRQAAATALAACGVDAIDPLVAALADDDRVVQRAAATALSRLGPPALAPTVRALAEPASERAALLALEGLPAGEAAQALRHYAERRVASALGDHDLAQAVEPWVGDDRVRLLWDSLRDRAQGHALNALRALRLLGDRDALSAALENLGSPDARQRANALEALESVRGSRTIRPLFRLWESPEPARQDGGLGTPLARMMNDADPWLRACAALAAGAAADSALRDDLAQMAQSDPDSLARATAAAALDTNHAMDTLPTLSLMERILFLRGVSLFAHLTPADLKQVAGIASEHYFPDGALIAAQGEVGEEMFIIASGEVRVIRGSEGRLGSEVARRQRGEVVGEMSVLSQEPRIASLVADGEVRTLCINRKEFEGLLRERPDTCLAVIRVLCARLGEAAR